MPQSEQQYWEANFALVDDPNLLFFQWYDSMRARACGFAAHGTSLELGVGSGHFTQEAGVSIGLDLSLSSVRRLQARTGLPCIQASAAALPLADESLDAVFTNDVLHHLKGDNVLAPSLAEIRRVLKPGGTWYISDRRAAPLNSLLLLLNDIARSVYKKLLRMSGKTVQFSGSDVEPPMTAADYEAIAGGMDVVSVTRWRTCLIVPLYGAFQFLRLALPEDTASRLAPRVLRLMQFCERLSPDCLKTDELLALRKSRPTPES